MNSGLSIQHFQLPICKYNNQIIAKVNQKLLIKNDGFFQQFYFDYFQQKVAFLTFDGFVKIYDIIQTRDGQKHIFNCEFMAHQGAIKSLTWQSPSMDSMIATCGDQDKTIKVFKETGKVWREIKQISDNRKPLKVQWIENELQLLIGYYEGDIEIRQGDNYQLAFSIKMFKNLIDFDLQLMQQDAILISSGVGGDSNYVFQIQIIKLGNKEKIDFKSKFTQPLASQIQNLKIAPYINDNEIKVAGLYDNRAIIIFIEYNEQLSQNIDKITDQFIDIDSNVWQFQWSIFGNELQIYTENGVRVYQQNIDDKFVIL
ncbi:unnamed protein product [Paramecium sonneborni]|uniref:WD40-repeat-containing domain n=1 Tax=Paramecium sonneborni TaxID=65129 RepID=A0A8S1LPE4_9CILI|nr:unnamed protein product [Paramecium sonneborni]